MGPSYTADEAITVLTQEYEGVTSSNVIFKDFYQLKQECNENVQVFSIQLRDMLTRLSIRFSDRVPKEDHDKILKDSSFYGIKSDICNSICHLYDDDTVTFSHLLVKAHRNEEEETASKLMNKSAVTDFSLEERVDRLIAKSNQSNQPNPSPSRDNKDNSYNYGRPLFQPNQRSRCDYSNNLASHEVILDKT